ncbi:hypothetical protein LTR08_003283 [Meristemomyces frigidus]|nr:hypothetical protein LTR08_003283 [Meristemomyces frigidus]
MAKTAAPPVSDYEQARAEKIAKNKALLLQLQLDAQQTGIGAKPSPAASSSTAGHKRKRTVARVKKEDVAPRRTSARLQGIVADSEVARQKDEADADVFVEQQRVKRERVSADINLGDAVVSGRTWAKAGNWLSIVGPANPGERTFSVHDVRDTTDQELRAVRERMSALTLWEGAEPNRIKITPERIYSLAFHPTPDKALVFAGDKLGNLGIFDSSQPGPDQLPHEAPDADEDGDSEPDPAITTFKIHTRTISALHFSPHDPNALYTSSYDSSIRALDLAKGAAVEVYAPSDRTADEALSGVEMSALDPHMLHFTTLTGAFGLHDLRTPSHEARLMQLHDKKIGGFSLHPAEPHLLATASLDRTLKVWDLRQMRRDGEGGEKPVLVGEHTSRLSVSHAAFNSAGQIATASYDDTVKIHTLPPQSSSSPSLTTTTSPTPPTTTPQLPPPTTLIPHNNQTGRWVTILRPHWHAHPPDGIHKFAIANMNRFVDVYTASGAQVAQLGGQGVTAVPAVSVFHPGREWVAGGNGSGKLCLWM